MRLKPCANGRNIGGQQFLTLLDVTCWVRLHTLLHVVMETGQTLKPRANERKIVIVGQQLPTLLDVTSWVRLHTLLHVVVVTGQTLKPRVNERKIVIAGQQLPTLLDVTCWVHLHTVLHVVASCCAMLDPFAQLLQHCWGHARALHMVCLEFTKFYRCVSFPRCTAGPNIVWSCCIRLHTTAKTDTTIPNSVASVFTGLDLNRSPPFLCVCVCVWGGGGSLFSSLSKALGVAV